MSVTLTLTGAEVLRPNGWDDGPLAMAGGLLVPEADGRRIDLGGFRILPGLVDCHGDGFERHMAPRRGALLESRNGIIATEAELAASGITTACLAQFFSWEGGMRGPDFAEHVFRTVSEVSPDLATDLRLQLRFETHLLDDIARAEAAIAHFGIDYVVFNDHLPHKRLSEGRKPPRLTGQALKSGRSPESHLAFMQSLHARTAEVPEAMQDLSARLARAGVRMGSHDDHTPEDRLGWRALGVTISEFPETMDAARTARHGGDFIILGSPNVVRGASHAGNASARDLVAAGLCDALASDYHYPAMRQAAFVLHDEGICDLATAWGLISSGPADLLGLSDRGRLTDGCRADMVVLDPNNRVAATIAGGRITYLTGEAGRRFIG